MNPALHAAIFSAANQASEQSVEARLRAAGALGDSSAIAFEPANSTEQTLLDHGLATGVIRRNAEGHLFLNEQALADYKQGQGWTALVVLLVIGSLIASGIALAIAL